MQTSRPGPASTEPPRARRSTRTSTTVRAQVYNVWATTGVTIAANKKCRDSQSPLPDVAQPASSTDVIRCSHLVRNSPVLIDRHRWERSHAGCSTRRRLILSTLFAFSLLRCSPVTSPDAVSIRHAGAEAASWSTTFDKRSRAVRHCSTTGQVTWAKDYQSNTPVSTSSKPAPGLFVDALRQLIALFVAIPSAAHRLRANTAPTVVNTSRLRSSRCRLCSVFFAYLIGVKLQPNCPFLARSRNGTTRLAQRCSGDRRDSPPLRHRCSPGGVARAG